MMNPNNLARMPINQNNNNNLSNNEILMNLINQNNQMVTNIGMNNEMIKNMLNNMKNTMEKKLLNIDFFPCDDRVNKMNVLFKGVDGSIINVIAPIDVRIKELFKIFYIKYQISAAINERQIKKIKDFLFIYRGSVISLDDKRSVVDLGFTEGVNDVVFKLKNELIGG